MQISICLLPSKNFRFSLRESALLAYPFPGTDESVVCVLSQQQYEHTSQLSFFVVLFLLLSASTHDDFL